MWDLNVNEWNVYSYVLLDDIYYCQRDFVCTKIVLVSHGHHFFASVQCQIFMNFLHNTDTGLIRNYFHLDCMFQLGVKNTCFNFNFHILTTKMITWIYFTTKNYQLKNRNKKFNMLIGCFAMRCYWELKRSESSEKAKMRTKKLYGINS